MKEKNIMIIAENKAHLPCNALNVLYLSDKGNLDGNFEEYSLSKHQIILGLFLLRRHERNIT